MWAWLSQVWLQQGTQPQKLGSRRWRRALRWLSQVWIQPPMVWLQPTTQQQRLDPQGGLTQGCTWRVPTQTLAVLPLLAVTQGSDGHSLRHLMGVQCHQLHQ